MLTDRSRGFVYVARKADPRRAEKLEKLGFAGLGFYPEELRFYPQGPVAAQILGYAGLDNQGLEGLERSLEGTLAGKPGSQTIVKDPFGRALDVVETKPETPGKDVRLTIDRQIQANAEEILAETVRHWSAKSATAVVMDPQTGAVLAMATAPRFNANRFPTTRADRRRNRAVTDTYEPGSTFKLVTVAAGLQEGIVNPRSSFRLPPTLKVADRTIREAHSRGTERMTVRQIVEYSSNIGTITIAQRLGEGRLASWIDRFGFGKQHRHRLPRRVGGFRASARPVVGVDDRHRPDRARHRRHAGSDGARVLGHRERRHARAAASDRPDRRRRASRPGRDGVSSRETSRSRCSRCCAASSSREPARRRRFPDTPWPARRAPRRRSTPTARTRRRATSRPSSGLVPASKPKLVVMVMVDEPRGGIYGGDIAAPAFREIARFNLQYLEIPQDAPKTASTNR